VFFLSIFLSLESVFLSYRDKLPFCDEVSMRIWRIMRFGGVASHSHEVFRGDSFVLSLRVSIM
jgi:hypothetical protein